MNKTLRFQHFSQLLRFGVCPFFKDEYRSQWPNILYITLVITIQLFKISHISSPIGTNVSNMYTQNASLCVGLPIWFYQK